MTGGTAPPEAPGPRRDLAWIALAAAPGLAIAAARHLGLDFWYDEVRTLRQVVLVPLGVTLTDYLEPNNHVLFSILANLWCRLLGVGDLAAALDRPVALRLLPFLLAVPGPILLGLAARRLLDRGAGMAAAALFASALPFANFACQFRGYGLGLTLVAALLLFAVRFRQEGWAGDAVLVVIPGALAVWAIPLHLYTLGALALAHGGLWAARVRGVAVLETRIRDLWLAALAVAAGGLGLALYVPVTGSVLSNHWSEPKGWPGPDTLTGVLPGVLEAMVAGRIWIVAAFVGGAAALRLRRGGAFDRPAERALAWGAALALLPFAVSALRGDRPFDRAFLQVLPAFALAGAAALRAALASWHARPWVAPVAVAALAVGGWLALDARDRRLAEDIENGAKSQSIDRAYFLAHYRPGDAVARLRSDARLMGLPVLLGDHDIEALPAYFSVRGLRVHAPVGSGDPLPRVVITSRPGDFEYSRRGGERFLRLDPAPAFETLFLVEEAPR
jgi:hypothetical protein